MAFLLCVIVFAGDSALVVLSVIATDGATALLWVGAAALLGWVILSSMKIVHTGGAPVPQACVTSAAMGLGVYSLAALGLGLCGLLNRGTALALPAASIALWAIVFFKRHGNVSLAPQCDAARSWLRAPAGCAWLWLIAMPALAIAAVGATVPPLFLWKPDDPHPYDVLEYHLQVPREWYQLGRIVPLHHNVFSFFPFNQEMQYLLAMHIKGGPWSAMFLAQFMSLSMAGLCVAAVHATVRTLAPVRPAMATIGAVSAAAVPWLAMLGCVAYNETGLLFFCTLTIAWAMTAARSGRLRDAAVAGIMAGLACGTKSTAAPILLLALPAMMVVCVPLSSRQCFARRSPSGPRTDDTSVAPSWHGRPARARSVLLYLSLAIVTLSPWLIRNLAWSGNPVFPEAMPLLGRGHFTQHQVERWEAAHAPRADQRALVARLSAVSDQILLDWRYAWTIWPLTIAAIIRGRRQRDTWVLAAILISLLVFWLAFTHLQSRFFVLSIPIAAMLIGIVPWPKRAMWIPAVILLIPAITTIATLHPRLRQAIAPTPDLRTPGLDDFGIPEPMAAAAAAGKRFVLVGDAAAYRYSLDASRLRYRTVFDVVMTDRGITQSWQGGPLAADEVTVILISELERLSRTYRGLTPFDPRKDALRAGAIILDSQPR